ncbi:heme NO-binding domain-containing protein [Paracoccus sp. MBLB3053]|uniref:Heme NO-binding domain-containing protein n=1 Tax=Paracoccus aurantius TaxID=3073814 RepID=A0ABU2HTW5_9RHOB|nr:heme NO-binding domain-containing protein [Paracoccus sp. MBLB3053]MDS9468182.1 heme NO-binding domain-containing protein [Paracoccus sp. MBLB3053]
MNGLIIRSIEQFLRTSYGDAFWQEVAKRTAIDPHGVLSINSPSSHLARRLVLAAAALLRKCPSEILEDLGGWMVRLEPIRRLLRFRGPDFAEFIKSLDELPARAAMVLPDFDPPDIIVRAIGPDEFEIESRKLPPGWIWVLAGVIRGMADDHGTLSLIEVAKENIVVRVVLMDHGVARPFALSTRSQRRSGK